MSQHHLSFRYSDEMIQKLNSCLIQSAYVEIGFVTVSHHSSKNLKGTLSEELPF